MKDQLSADASNRKISLDIQSELNQDSIQHVLNKLNPMITAQYEIAKKHQLIDGLKELVMGEEDTSFLSPEYKEILRDADAIKAKYQEQPRMLAYLWTVIADLYGDAAKRNGRHNVQEQLKQLRVLLNNYDFEALSNFFAKTL